MIAKNKFVALNPKQKIYKIAEMMRTVELVLKEGGDAAKETGHLWQYIGYVRPEAAQRRIAKALTIIDRYLESWDSLDNRSAKIEKLNFCFHEVLALIDESVGEKFYRVKQFDSRREIRRFPVAAILDNIRSPFNVGNIFRSADSFGVGELRLCGITPHPPSLKIERTAMGTLETVNWSYHDRTADAILDMREQGWKVYALETAEGAEELNNLRDFTRTAFVFGNEEFGITDETLSLCDGVIEIPLVGTKNSINVSNTFAVVMYQAMCHFLRDNSLF